MVNKVLIPGNFRDNQGCSQSKTAAKVTAEAMAQSTAVRGLTGSIPPNGKSGPRWESDNAATVTTNPPPEYWVGWSPSQRESGQTGNRPGSPRRCRQHGPARLVVDPYFSVMAKAKARLAACVRSLKNECACAQANTQSAPNEGTSSLPIRYSRGTRRAI